MAVAFRDRVRVAPDVLFRTISDEAVLVNLKTGMYLGLNQVGTRMWTVLNAADSVEDAYDDLLDEYEVEPSELRRDLQDFVDKLVGHQLIEAGPPTA
ncbi:MAG TPA: PqqD family protein [Vicinamibacterales bacterium]|jgi:hypothetical protein|nr:PqqD family protein [Vicinamibacterales bacterium]